MATATKTTIAHPGSTTSNNTTQGQQTAAGLINLPPGGLIQFPSLYQFLGISQINFADVGIRAGLILVGVILLIVVAVKLLAKPAVEITETAAKAGELAA